MKYFEVNSMLDLKSRVLAAINAFRRGLPVVLTDDADRENEADLVMPACMINHKWMARMIHDGSGIVCLTLTQALADAMQLPYMVAQNQSKEGTAFTVSVDARFGISTGVSAADRVHTIKAVLAEHAGPDDLVRPGHVFPLIANPGGVLVRRGHTEGSVDLCLLAGLPPAGVICELMCEDGRMLTGTAIDAYAQRYQLPVLSIEDIALYRSRLLDQSELAFLHAVRTEFSTL
ncbi:3,4-dihydroxy-2-butanone-4-phosphate synthase [Aquitalea denitrificans]|uniref:3,4-dihydroxy-2-butanone-4-phosphate synthase n=1 Tax=Aquitalea denitrificans TaxID=519081 RepID=UPI00135B932C|nr:3,4-dihydroxy-2-butanone-4-phosphate synthase [Aquitalea denitrificans]